MGVRLVVYNSITSAYDEGALVNIKHEDILNRDKLDQHPIYAISGLQEVLNTIESNIITINNLIINQNQELKDYTDTEIDKESNIINTRIDGIESNLVNDFLDSKSIDFTHDKPNQTVTAEVKIYNDPEDTNILVKTDDGLYVPKLVTRDSDSITWNSISYGKTLSELFEDGIRFSHQDTTNYNNMYKPDEANAWYWDDTLQSFVQPNNTTSYNGIVSNDFYGSYKHSVRLLSSDGDNDANGIVLGFVFDEYGQPHTLSAMIQRGGGIQLNYKFAIIYNFLLPGQTLVASYNLNNSNSGWNTATNGISLYAVKNKNIISVSATSWDYNNTNTTLENAENMPFETTLTIDLNTFSWGHYFSDKVRYGYSNISQAHSYFDKVFFYSLEEHSAVDATCHLKVSRKEHNALEINSDGAYVEQFLVSSDEGNALEKREDGYYSRAMTMYISDKRQNGLIHEGNSYYYVHKSHSFVEVHQENHGLNVGDFIYYSPSSYKYEKAIAIDNYHINIVGMVSYVEDENNFEYVCNGFVETNLFDEEHDFVQGLPIYISSETAGAVTQIQPDISKAVGYPIENIGLIISIERGIQYNQESSIGDFKTSSNDYNIRSDGFIKIEENIEYNTTLIQKLINTVDVIFKENYMNINSDVTTFKNVDALRQTNNVATGINLFIKAF